MGKAAKSFNLHQLTLGEMVVETYLSLYEYEGFGAPMIVYYFLVMAATCHFFLTTRLQRSRKR